MEQGSARRRAQPVGCSHVRHAAGLASPDEKARMPTTPKWLDQTEPRARSPARDRIHGNTGIMPVPLWIVFLFHRHDHSRVPVGMADSGERVRVGPRGQGSSLPSASLLLLLQFLDNPFVVASAASNRSRWNAACKTIDRGLAVIGGGVTIPCDNAGNQTWARGGRRRPPLSRRGTIRSRSSRLSCSPSATVATAWRGYQANRWNSKTTKASSRVNALRVDAARAQGLAQAQTQVDIATFIQWVNATATDEPELADFYEARFRPEFKPGLRRLGGDGPADQSRCPADTVRHGGVPAAGRVPTSSASTPRRSSPAATVRRNIQRSANYAWPSCSSPSPCSSPG